MNKKIILVDIDGVLADFEMGFIKAWGKKFPTHPKVPLEGRKAFRLAESYPNGLEKEIQSILSAPGFFENLNTIPGGKEALKKMQDLGHEVLICTSPISNYKNCVPEKYRWVAINLGFEWTKRIIMIKDKTLVFGDILIDDKPEHTGLREPVWKHVLFEAPYNQHVKTKLRITWDNWERILE
ncbi:MAG: 5'(3')-deoxyribonucleotidase [Candidatus Nomurabacteria bacterium GW2011_GWA1_37_20]|uniref:5'(3')-deoxyribonucleotidase n=1 Tax=Candidatus Nomurabacteria bacterium GW2011_GWA1_37_20 TaxID=1618729 RepID=A0A0G0H584_9BACT|nr:MAG: 5'(3')-deoxyribonucleotidase [Candidatus Nomurabacteria bacterium GW2011_GWA1_37_20]KKQ38049.1 MAG: 5'(3')-deoxyribonucleotidase [Candidatus Levybacteria bacterium GW2011_GWC2_37_7]KKQ42879.1 MAG: 5'(3')-deoxyribonucleotidase [Candidatus Levybacteria bacterium GW2011_GWB1_37_8]OGH51609.1 MAG: hypothetical protein A3H17_02590 [Candidatus Levybacteria bacterium RIFCSPLOWO2_12_FULL_37_14]